MGSHVLSFQLALGSIKLIFAFKQLALNQEINNRGCLALKGTLSEFDHKRPLNGKSLS
jgi:hypothetical protein